VEVERCEEEVQDCQGLAPREGATLWIARSVHHQVYQITDCSMCQASICKASNSELYKIER